MKNIVEMGSSKSRGFSLIELLVVTAIIGVLSSVLVLNFRTLTKNKAALSHEAFLIAAEIRRAQTLAAVSSKFNGEIPCGYGIHFVSSNSSIIYFGSKPLPSDTCAAQNRNYGSPPDKTYLNIKFTRPDIEFKNSFSDIFFDPPDPKTYINNDPSLSLPPLNITIGFIGLACPENCKTVQVFTSGRIETQ